MDRKRREGKKRVSGANARRGEKETSLVNEVMEIGVDDSTNNTLVCE